MTKRELIEALEALDCADSDSVVIPYYDAEWGTTKNYVPALEVIENRCTCSKCNHIISKELVVTCGAGIE